MKIRSFLIIFSTLYLVAAAVLLSRIEEDRERLQDPVPNEARVFCWSEKYRRFDQSAVDISLIDKSYNASLASREDDLDADGKIETYALSADGILTVTEDGKEIWHTDEGWKVEGFFLTDADNDGIADLSLSVWKPGNYGEAMPFWVGENDMSVRNHFFVYSLEDDRMRPVWQSSNLAAPDCGFTIDDIDADGKNELIAMEGDYADAVCRGRRLSVWRWHEWGFLNEWKSEDGNFEGVALYAGYGGKCFAGY